MEIMGGFLRENRCRHEPVFFPYSPWLWDCSCFHVNLLVCVRPDVCLGPGAWGAPGPSGSYCEVTLINILWAGSTATVKTEITDLLGVFSCFVFLVAPWHSQIVNRFCLFPFLVFSFNALTGNTFFELCCWFLLHLESNVFFWQ